VRESVLLTKKQAAFKDVTVEQHLVSHLPRAHVDKGQIQQTLINLILNAAESTDAGGVIRVSTSLDDKRREIHITISDTGEGIPDDMINKIFDPFFTTKADGNGLGLAITHGIIEQHGGRIDVQSNVGEGTIFNIRIPMENGVVNESK
jgi:two-component system, NtrC family, sensor kinase